MVEWVLVKSQECSKSHPVFKQTTAIQQGLSTELLILYATFYCKKCATLVQLKTDLSFCNMEAGHCSQGRS